MPLRCAKWFFTAAHIDLVLCVGSRIWVRGVAQLWRFGKFHKWGDPKRFRGLGFRVWGLGFGV